MKNIWLLGDSIRLSYQPAVQKLLSGAANVCGPKDNCRYSLYTLSSFENWLEELSVPDIVHWNNGLWDVGHDNQRAPEQFPIEYYLKNLEVIIGKLKLLNTKIIWATTTPVIEYSTKNSDQWYWKNEEINEYNIAAKKLMNKNSIPINDLHSIVQSDINYNICEDRLHLSERGVTVCSEAVSQILKKFI